MLYNVGNGSSLTSADTAEHCVAIHHLLPSLLSCVSILMSDIEMAFPSICVKTIVYIVKNFLLSGSAIILFLMSLNSFF